MAEELELVFCEGWARHIADELLPADLVTTAGSDLGVDLEGGLFPLLVPRQRDDAGGGLRGGEPPRVVVLGRLGLVIEVAVAAEPSLEACEDLVFEGCDVDRERTGIVHEVEASVFGLHVRAVVGAGPTRAR